MIAETALSPPFEAAIATTVGRSELARLALMLALDREGKRGRAAYLESR